jgi:hypothetical protein
MSAKPADVDHPIAGRPGTHHQHVGQPAGHDVTVPFAKAMAGPHGSRNRRINRFEAKPDFADLASGTDDCRTPQRAGCQH